MLSYHIPDNIRVPDTSGTLDPRGVHVRMSTLWRGMCHSPNTTQQGAFQLASFQHAEKMLPHARQNQSRDGYKCLTHGDHGDQWAKDQLHWRREQEDSQAPMCRAERPAAHPSASPEGPQSNMRSAPSLQKVLRQVGSYEEEMKSLARALEGVALSDVKTCLPEVGLRSTNSFHTAPQTDTLPFLRSTDAYIYLNHCSSQGLY